MLSCTQDERSLFYQLDALFIDTALFLGRPREDLSVELMGIYGYLWVNRNRIGVIENVSFQYCTM